VNHAQDARFIQRHHYTGRRAHVRPTAQQKAQAEEPAAFFRDKLI
jgi:hypothetical protein